MLSVNNLETFENILSQAHSHRRKRFISKPPDRNLLFQKSSFMMQRERERGGKDTNKIFCQFFFSYHSNKKVLEEEIFRSFFCLWFHNNFLTWQLIFFCCGAAAEWTEDLCINHIKYCYCHSSHSWQNFMWLIFMTSVKRFKFNAWYNKLKYLKNIKLNE